MSSLKDELATKQTERWKAVGMFRHILAFAGLSWKLKKHAIDFLLSINGFESFDDKESDYISYMPSLFAALQVVTRVLQIPYGAPILYIFNSYLGSEYCLNSSLLVKLHFRLFR